MCESCVSIGAIIQLILMAIAVEAIVEIAVDSALLGEIRSYIKDLCYPKVPRANAWIAWMFFKFNYLVNCGYCMSVWCAAIVSSILYIPISGIGIVDWLFTTAVTHRLSNLYHVFFMLVKHGRVHTISGEIAHTVENKK